ncbi:hypothetical protein H5410_051031 [Solanum commersonii]|uniref:Uncharacterized protein n=1 Tax=Solanum commersonii TaxID=4109 RepID=A0A9J5WZB9_SOLCO|nr:hypothetical protein H5410_051031 [Solanum commersonii]
MKSNFRNDARILRYMEITILGVSEAHFRAFWGRFQYLPLGTFVPECQRNIHEKHQHGKFSPQKDATMHLHLISKTST